MADTVYMVLLGVVLAVAAICVYERLRRRKQAALDGKPAAERHPRWLRILAEYTIGGQPGQEKPTD